MAVQMTAVDEAVCVVSRRTEDAVNIRKTTKHEKRLEKRRGPLTWGAVCLCPVFVYTSSAIYIILFIHICIKPSSSECAMCNVDDARAKIQCHLLTHATHATYIHSM